MQSPQSQLIDIRVNGAPMQVPQAETLLGLLERLKLDPARVAIELDRRIVKQPQWGSTRLEEGSAVEIVQFVGGG